MNKIIFGLIALSMLGILGISFVSAFPLGKVSLSDLSDEEKAENQAFRESIQQAIESDDYESWKSLMESQLTEEKFQKIVEMKDKMSEIKELREELKQAEDEGDKEKASVIREELSNLMPQKEFGQMPLDRKDFFERR